MHNATMNDSPESRKAVFRKLVELYAAGDISALDEVIAPNYVGHPSAGDRDLEGFRQSILYFHKLFVFTQDSFQIEDQLVDGEKVAIHSLLVLGMMRPTPPAPPALPSPTEGAS
jgi:hypothetical protein